MDGDSDLKGPWTDDLNCPIGRIRRRTRIEDTQFVRRNVARNFLIVVLLSDYYYHSSIKKLWLFNLVFQGTVPTRFQHGSNAVLTRFQHRSSHYSSPPSLHPIPEEGYGALVTWPSDEVTQQRSHQCQPTNPFLGINTGPSTPLSGSLDSSSHHSPGLTPECSTNRSRVRHGKCYSVPF